MDATRRLTVSTQELRIPAIVVVAGTSLIGASAGSLGGPFAAALFGLVGFAGGGLAVLVSLRLNRSPRRAMFANAALYVATLAMAALTGVGFQIMPIMDISIDQAPQFFADLVRPPIGDAEALPYYVVNTSLEWLLIPAALVLNGWIPKRQRLIVAAAVTFFALRVWSYLYFIPDILDWNQGTTGQPLTAAELEQAALWVDLSWIRVAMDAVIAMLLLGAAFIPAVGPRSRKASDANHDREVAVS
jgi:hypothetical protein